MDDYNKIESHYKGHFLAGTMYNLLVMNQLNDAFYPKITIPVHISDGKYDELAPKFMVENFYNKA